MGATANTSINRVAHRVLTPATVDGMSTTRDPNTLDRHEFVRAALLALAGVTVGAALSGCSGGSTGGRESERGSADDSMTTASNVVLAYFSRAGENYYYGGRTNLEVGNTEVLAGMIRDLIGCEVHRIDPLDPYPYDYEETVERNVREQDADARPAIANPLASIDGYDIVLLGSPVWNVRAPMIMSTFAERYDFTGKTVFPFTTYAVSGLGTVVEDYRRLCPGASIGEGLAVRGERVRDADAAVEAWLRRINLLEG
jgi:flavodoxin